jgi:heme oxygenase
LSDAGGARTSFAEQIRSATWARHEEAAGSPFLRALFEGTLDRDGYVAMVAQHHAIYGVLEDAASAMDDDPVAGPFVVRELHRGDALRRDLDALAGPDWRDAFAPSPATEAYCDRLREVCWGWPGGFVAHHYTRYLGDLSGGQVIRGAVERAYALEGGVGVEFYDFGAVGDLAAFKADYRARLDAAPWDDDERVRIVDEMLLAYDHNLAVLAELDQVTA